MNYKNERKRWGWVCGCAVLFVASVACAKSTVPETIIFAGDDNYPPLQWVDESGKNRGMIFELEKSIRWTDTKFSIRFLYPHKNHELTMSSNIMQKSIKIILCILPQN